MPKLPDIFIKTNGCFYYTDSAISYDKYLWDEDIPTWELHYYYVQTLSQASGSLNGSWQPGKLSSFTQEWPAKEMRGSWRVNYGLYGILNLQYDSHGIMDIIAIYDRVNIAIQLIEFVSQALK